MNEIEFSERLPGTTAVFREGVDRQLHTGMQLYVSLQGKVIADGGIGVSAPDQPMTRETINPWLSAGKPLTVVAILQLWEQGITIRHLLTHTGGFRNVETGWPDVPWEESIARICDSALEPDWIVGRTAGYHTATSWFILGEILSRLSGRSYAEAMRKELLDPLNLHETWVSLDGEEYAEHAARLGKMFVRESAGLRLLDWHERGRCQRPSPGANSRGPIRELGRFYEMLLNEGATPNGRIVSAQTVAAMTARHRVGEFDLTLAHAVDFGLGVIIDSNRYGAETVPYGYGRYCSPRTFGHGGAQSSQGWCDPESGLVVAYFFNGRPGEGQHGRRTRKLNEAICLDLQLT